jgi:hypothetical protein
MTVRLPIDLRRRPAKPQRMFVLADLSAVGEDLPGDRAEDLADALRANTIRRVLVRHGRSSARECGLGGLERGAEPVGRIVGRGGQRGGEVPADRGRPSRLDRFGRAGGELGGGVLGAGAGELAHVAGGEGAALGECRGELVLEHRECARARDHRPRPASAAAGSGWDTL